MRDLLLCLVAATGLSASSHTFADESCATAKNAKAAVECLEAKMKAIATLPSVLPTGLIAFFNLPECPAGWRPNKEAGDRYLVIAGPRRRANTIGGANTVTLQVPNMPRHSHGLLVGTNNFVLKNDQYLGHLFTGRDANKKEPRGPVELRLTEEEGQGAPFDVSPEFYALTMCEKL